MLRSVGDISTLITEEVQSGTDPNRIVLGGFSQGASMSLLTGLTSEKKLAGLAVLSGWLIMKDKIKGVGAHSTVHERYSSSRARCFQATQHPFPSFGVQGAMTL
jgi:predicted esterase